MVPGGACVLGGAGPGRSREQTRPCSAMSFCSGLEGLDGARAHLRVRLRHSARLANADLTDTPRNGVLAAVRAPLSPAGPTH